MQRRNVDLPEPDGPITQATSPGCTTRSTPRSTSTRPKLLWMSTASTIGGVAGLVTGLSPSVVPLDVALPDRQHRGQRQVPGGRHDEQRDRLEVGRVDPLHRGE